MRSSLPVIFLGLSFFASSLVTSGAVVNNSGTSKWRTNATESAIDFTKNDLLLGSQDTLFWFLIPLFGIISVGTCVVVNYVLMALIHALSALRGILVARTGYIKHDDQR